MQNKHSLFNYNFFDSKISNSIVSSKILEIHKDKMPNPADKRSSFFALATPKQKKLER
jgi:hypothetical protein